MAQMYKNKKAPTFAGAFFIRVKKELFDNQFSGCCFSFFSNFNHINTSL